MSAIDSILQIIKPALEELQKRKSDHVEGNEILTKLSIDRDAGVIRIYTDDSDYIKRASSGLGEVLELAYTTAEHHPYWILFYHAAEICKIVLEKWESELDADQLSELSWRCDEIKMGIDKITETR
jgi:hypothetical protein